MDSVQNRELRIFRSLKAPIDRVWKVWSDPEHIVNWWGPNGHTNIIHTMDFREGGEWKLTIIGPGGRKYPNRSLYREIIPMRKIAFEHFNPHFVSTIAFKPAGPETLLEWVTLFDNFADFEAIVKTFKADEGQKENLERLERYLNQ